MATKHSTTIGSKTPRKTRKTLARRPAQKKSRDAVNVAPSQWGRRLARLTGQKFGVKMVENHSKNEGTLADRDLAIKCAKSTMPPISVLAEMLKRLDDVWAVYLLPDGSAQVWSITAQQMRRHAYFTRGIKVARRAEIYLRKIEKIGVLIGNLTKEEVESCEIP